MFIYEISIEFTFIANNSKLLYIFILNLHFSSINEIVSKEIEQMNENLEKEKQDKIEDQMMQTWNIKEDKMDTGNKL
jgi:hypothetical protein